MLYKLFDIEGTVFRTTEEVRAQIITGCRKNPAIAEHCLLGKSEEGRPIDGVIMGSGAITVCLMAGAHSDEPAGPETLRTFVLQTLAQPDKFKPYLEKYRFVIIPHINPDGEARNQAWIKNWPDVSAYLRHADREPPGRDLEFGYPDMRRENRLISAFLKKNAPYDLYLNLHSMGFSEGAMLLIERHWIDRTGGLQERFTDFAKKLGLKLHDHDRRGEKGFIYISPGFTTTPEGKAMQEHFQEQGNDEMAKKFRLISMEYIRSLGGDPLCLVTELPLFIVGKEVENKPAGVPAAYLEFKNKIPSLKAKLYAGQSIAKDISEFHIRSFELEAAIRFHLYVIQLGLDIIGSGNHA